MKAGINNLSCIYTPDYSPAIMEFTQEQVYSIDFEHLERYKIINNQLINNPYYMGIEDEIEHLKQVIDVMINRGAE